MLVSLDEPRTDKLSVICCAVRRPKTGKFAMRAATQNGAGLLGLTERTVCGPLGSGVGKPVKRVKHGRRNGKSC